MGTPEPWLLDLKRHLVAGFDEPSPLWIAPARGPHLGFSGEDVTETANGCQVTFGTVSAIGEQQRSLHVENLGGAPVTVTAEETLPGLQIHWTAPEDRDASGVELVRGGESATLELTFWSESPQESDFSGSLRLLAASPSGERRTYEIRVELRTVMDVPFGRYDFGGSPEPSRHDFGRIDPAAPDAPRPYTLAIEGEGKVPLNVSLENLPAWLSLEMEGFVRSGPAPGRFFEHAAPVRLTFRPIPSLKFLGRQRCRLLLCTNDARQRYRRMEIELSVRIEVAKPYVYSAAPASVEVSAGAVRVIDLAFLNWGGAPAHLSRDAESHEALQIGACPSIPEACGPAPGQEILQVAVDSARLAPGRHFLPLALRVEDGSPAKVTIPVEVVLPEGEAGRSLWHPSFGSRGRRKVYALALMALVLMLTVLLLIFFQGGR